MRTKQPKQEIYRQGDVLIRRLAELPNGEHVSLKDGVLAYGEATGHSHRVSDLSCAELFTCGNGKYLSVTEAGVAIIHDEHAPIELGQGHYEVIQQREYTPEAIRNVAD
jgi:hypothetical protein